MVQCLFVSYRVRSASQRLVAGLSALRSKFRVALTTALIIASAFVTSASHADVYCSLSNFQVDTYDHGGVYLHGTLNGLGASFISICGQTSGSQDCNTKATDRRLAVALAAQAQGKSLLIWFFGPISQCSQFTPYMVAGTLIVSP
jgi:hypothetical protein